MGEKEERRNPNFLALQMGREKSRKKKNGSLISRSKRYL